MSYKRNDDEKKIILLKPFKELYSYLHFHKALEVIFVHEGVYEADVSVNHFTLIKDDILVVPSKSPHKINSTGNNCSCDILVIPENFFTPLDFSIDDCYYGRINDKSLFSNIQKIRNDGSFEDYSNFLLFLSEINKNYPKIKLKKDSKDGLTFELMKYVHENYNEQISLDNLSSEFGYSKYYISRLFNDSIGCPLNSYINYLRNDYIEENKKKGRKLIELIYESGFQTISAYYRFKKSQNKKPTV